MSLQKEHLGQLTALARPIYRTLQTTIQTLPRVAKWIVALLLLLNVKSLPLMWHLQVFQPVFRIRGEYLLLSWRTIFQSKKARAKRIDEWLDDKAPIGADPFDTVSVYKTRATFDDSDFNGHLSNSSYAKTLDSARLLIAIELFPQFFRAGGWMALGGTHFIYMREIPMLAKYEVRTAIASWDQKWLYFVHLFVTKPKGKELKQETLESNSKKSNTPDQAVQNLLQATLRTQADTVSGISTPAVSTPAGSSSQDTSATLKAVAASLVSADEPDGTVLHTIVVSQVCFKIGRITVPPMLSLAANGLTAPPSEFGSSLTQYSRKNPPPHWAKAKAVMSVPFGGSTKALKDLFVKDWRNAPENGKWWEQALSGLEQRRKARLEAVASLRSGTANAKTSVSP